MAKPANLDEYFQKILAVRAKLKEWKNSFPEEMDDLAAVMEEDLEAWGAGAGLAAYEAARISAALCVKEALTDFDNASV
jgi:hypothetical protein